MKYYVYSNRCQPLSLLIEKEIKWLADTIQPDDKIIIGIVNPSPSCVDPNDKANTWTRFKEEYNPLNYWERYCMLDSFLTTSGLSEKVTAIVPLARPSTNMKLASNYLPKNRIMCLPIEQQSTEEDMKREGMKRQSEEIFEIPAFTFPDNVDIISPELIFCLMGIGNEKWKSLVSKDVLAYLEELDIVNRVAAKMTRFVARETLSKIYMRTVKEEDKIIIASLLRGYRISNVPNDPKRVTPFEHNDEFTQERCDLSRDLLALRQEILSDLPSKSKAPATYEKFSLVITKLSEYAVLLESDRAVNVEKIQEIRQYYEEGKEQWHQEKN
ncbi:MAG: hypothetical protein K2I06_12575 [Ruminococcus sp.]|nr:hypothetical protein [Ruminococcus sp.]